ncbi:hypothetical protein F2Q68_00007227 [Brassica cretica]|uniref:Uncharacterized protein n=1 Tax=Brassica cretica TaxID=69181 RepID=A0A8S9KRS0_BRACR|nr:hypothetical protein F2Q68_00007227 [Brassica cretica]
MYIRRYVKTYGRMLSGEVLTRKLSKCPKESDVDLVWWRWSWRFVWCGDQAARWCDVLVGICGFASGVDVLSDVLGEVLVDVLGEVHGDVPSERWKVEALTQEKFSKDGFIEEVWKDCSCVKTVNSGAAG